MFSGVRAKYLDGKFQAPSLQVVIEGEQGSGKSCFNDIFKTIFSRVIASDAQKLKNEDSESIIQVIGIETSMARLLEIMAGNNGVHEYMMETEIDAVTERFKRVTTFQQSYFVRHFQMSRLHWTIRIQIPMYVEPFLYSLIIRLWVHRMLLTVFQERKLRGRYCVKGMLCRDT